MTDKRPPADQGWNAPGTCGGGYWRVVNGIYESWPPNPRNTVTMGAGLTMGAVAPSSPVETTDAPARPIPPEALNGLTGAAYSDVIRREAEGDWCAHVTLARIYREERDAALEGIIRRDDALGIYDDEVTKLHASLAERDATIERAKDVLFHCHADTCATELSPNAGYECTCWRGSLIEALQAADDRRAL